MQANFLTFTSGKLSESRIHEAFTEFLVYMRASFPGEFDSAYFSMSYIQKYTGGHVMFSDLRLVNTLLGYDLCGKKKLCPATMRVELDIPAIIATMEREYEVKSAQVKAELALNAVKQELILAREDEWKSGSLSEEMSILVWEEEILTESLDLMTYYLDLDISALEAKMRVNTQCETKDDLTLIAQAETERIVPVGVMVHLPELEVISFTQTKVKMYNTNVCYTRPVPSWIKEADIHTAFNRLMHEPEKLYPVNKTQTKSPLVERRAHGNEVVFKVHFLGPTSKQDLSYAMLTNTFISFSHEDTHVSVKFEPETLKFNRGEQVRNPKYKQRR